MVMEVTVIGALIADLASVFSSIISHVGNVLAIFVSSTVLILLLGLKFSGAIFGFASRLLHRR